MTYYPKRIDKLISISPSTKSWNGWGKLLTTVFKNIYFEVSKAFLGVRELKLDLPPAVQVSAQQIFSKITTHTYLDEARLRVLYQMVSHCRVLSGNCAELGVYQGGSAYLIASLMLQKSSEKRLELYDTFAGMPSSSHSDVYKKGDLSDTSLKQVQDYLHDFKQVDIFPGMFPQSISVSTPNYCFVHVDCDLYESVWAACEYFYPKMVQGGLILFDDYGFVSCPGAKKAVDDYSAQFNLSPIYLGTGQALIIKN